MSTSFSMTRTEIAQRVLGKVLKIGANAAASADYLTVYQALDLRLKEIHKLGIFWRKVTTQAVDISITAGSNSASSSAGDILFPIKMTYTNGSRDDPMAIVGIVDYARIDDKHRTGNPSKVLWKGNDQWEIWPRPLANGTMKLIYEKIADDTTADTAIDVDVAMIRPMMDVVKYDVADDYGIAEQTQIRWKAEQIQAEKDIRKLSVQRADFAPVAVDDFDSRLPDSRRPTDYGW